MIFFKKLKVLNKILDRLMEDEPPIKRIANFMNDYSTNRCSFGRHELNNIMSNGRPSEPMGIIWIGRTYGFSIDNHTAHSIMNEFLYMRQEIDRLEKLVEEKQIEP